MKKISQKLLFSIINPLEIIILSNIKINKTTVMKGEVTEPLTISVRTKLPFYNGLFCEKIFGTIIDWKCRCFNFNNRFIYNNKCINCNIIISSSKIRRYKYGYVYLNSYFLNLLYVNQLSLILDIKKNKLIKLFNYDFIFLNKTKDNYIYSSYFKITLLVYKILKNLNIFSEINNIKNKLLIYKYNSYKNYLLKKLKLYKLIYLSNIKLDWFLISIIPILPPSLRPLFYFNNNLFFLSNINKIYLNIIIHNNKLNFWLNNYLAKNVPYLYLIIQKKIIQKNINNLFNIKNNTKSYSTLLNSFIGKNNKFRENILGKRVDFSGRAVITSGPFNLINSIGLPINMALKLFNVFIFNLLNKYNLKNIKLLNSNFYIKFILNYINHNKFILFNRAPTLHKLNIQSFFTYFTEGDAIRFNPLLCTSFNADFDGDQMSLFIPIFHTSQLEAKYKINSINNIFNTISGNKIKKFTQSNIIGLNISKILYTFNLNKYNFIYFSSSYDVLNYQVNDILKYNKLLFIRYFFIFNGNFNIYNANFIINFSNRINK